MNRAGGRSGSLRGNRRAADERDELPPLHVSMAPALQGVMLRVVQVSLAVICSRHHTPADWKQTCTRNVGRVIALSVEPFYNPSGRSFIGL